MSKVPKVHNNENKSNVTQKPPGAESVAEKEKYS